MSINDIPLGRLKEILASDVPLTIVTTEALITRLEQAEAAVARVREVATEMANHTMPDEPKGAAWILAEGAQLFAKDVLEALDGDGRG